MFKDLLSHPEAFNKFWVALAGATAQLLLVCAPLDKEPAFVVTPAEWYTVLVAAATAVGVVGIANRTK
jgi:hypothetical protein